MGPFSPSYDARARGFVRPSFDALERARAVCSSSDVRASERNFGSSETHGCCRQLPCPPFTAGILCYWVLGVIVSVLLCLSSLMLSVPLLLFVSPRLVSVSLFLLGYLVLIISSFSCWASLSLSRGVPCVLLLCLHKDYSTNCLPR